MTERVYNNRLEVYKANFSAMESGSPGQAFWRGRIDELESLRPLLVSDQTTGEGQADER